MRTTFGAHDCQNLKNALRREWLETNGLGGFASSTIIGANTRRHHGLLVAALQPPVGRHVLLAKLEERVRVNDNEAHISTNLYPGTVFPHGFNIQTGFELQPWPLFRYATSDFEITKSVTLIHGENTAVIAYQNVRSRAPVELHARPLLAFRDHNSVSKRHEDVQFKLTEQAGTFSVQPYPALPRLHFHGRWHSLTAKPDWYHRFVYPAEEARGLECEEDLFTPAELTWQIPAGATVYLVVSTVAKLTVPAEELLARERARRAGWDTERDPVRRALLTAADAFIVRRGQDQTSVLAGYPWFTDSGRAALIALPGLTLTSGRFDIAKQVLLTFAGYAEKGLVPNVFPEAGGPPGYNTVDAALWFVVSTWRYWQASGDAAGVRQLLPALRNVVKHYRAGTRHDIRADSDGLITAGTGGTQLTWMDVKVDGYVPTPRHGKPVEVNALWFNALLMVADFEEKVAGDSTMATLLRQEADGVAASFHKAFWYAEGGYLYDVVRADGRDLAVRPNQILAVALPYTPLAPAEQRSVLAVVTQQLLTPYGLRSLSPLHEKYVGHYAGNHWQRDCAYHQGTVWPWLMGPYCDAYHRVHGPSKGTRQEIARILQPLFDHCGEAGLGSVAELFDGEPPHVPGGCFAQAWSVAEVLRARDTYLS